jgi:hypothetical protein
VAEDCWDPNAPIPKPENPKDFVDPIGEKKHRLKKNESGQFPRTKIEIRPIVLEQRDQKQ